jgi:gamma-glutamylaminecyclotransferase
VYGTLKRGLRNYFRISDQEFLGEAVTEPRYRVVDLGPHPGLIRDDANGLAIKGELFAVDARCLQALDAFEDVPAAFTRDPVAIVGRSEVIYAYFMNTPVPAGAVTGDRWPLG